MIPNFLFPLFRFADNSVLTVQSKLGKSMYVHHNIALHKHKALYFSVPKVACSSLKKALSECIDTRFIERPWFDKNEAIHYARFPYVPKNEVLSKYSEYFKFCFVRNPWDRILSCYSNKTTQDPENNSFPFINGVYQGFLKYKTFRAGMTFEEFVEAIVKIPDEEADPHFKSQYTFICDEQENLLVDFIGKFENLQDDFHAICKKIGADNITIPHLMSSKRKEKNYQNEYTKKTKNLIAERYKKDITLFKYTH